MEQKTTRLFEMQYNYSEDVIPDLVDIHASLSIQHLELINTPYHKSFTAKILSDFEESIREVLKEKDKILLLTSTDFRNKAENNYLAAKARKNPILLHGKSVDECEILGKRISLRLEIDISNRNDIGRIKHILYAIYRFTSLGVDELCFNTVNISSITCKVSNPNDIADDILEKMTEYCSKKADTIAKGIKTRISSIVSIEYNTNLNIIKDLTDIPVVNSSGYMSFDSGSLIDTYLTERSNGRLSMMDDFGKFEIETSKLFNDKSSTYESEANYIVNAIINTKTQITDTIKTVYELDGSYIN